MQIQGAISALARDEQFADLTFVVDGELMPAHVAVVVTASPVFKAMVLSSLGGKTATREEEELAARGRGGGDDASDDDGGLDDDGEEDEIVVKDISTRVFRVVLDVVYGRAPELSVTLVHPCLLAAQRFELPELTRLCKSFAAVGVTPDNACEVLMLSMSLTEVYEEVLALEVIQVHANRVLKSDDAMMQLSKEAMVMILSSSLLDVEEEVVWHALCKWSDSRHGAGQRLDQDLLDLVRFGEMPAEFVLGEVIASDLLDAAQKMDVLSQLSSAGQAPRLGSKASVVFTSVREAGDGGPQVTFGGQALDEDRPTTLGGKLLWTVHARHPAVVYGERPLHAERPQSWTVQFSGLDNGMDVCVGVVLEGETALGSDRMQLTALPSGDGRPLQSVMVSGAVAGVHRIERSGKAGVLPAAKDLDEPEGHPFAWRGDQEVYCHFFPSKQLLLLRTPGMEIGDGMRVYVHGAGEGAVFRPCVVTFKTTTFRAWGMPTPEAVLERELADGGADEAGAEPEAAADEGADGAF